MDEKVQKLVDILKKMSGSDITQLEVGDTMLFKDAIDDLEPGNINLRKTTLLSNAINHYSFETGKQFEWNFKKGHYDITVRRVK